MTMRRGGAFAVIGSIPIRKNPCVSLKLEYNRQLLPGPLFRRWNSQC